MNHYDGPAFYRRFLNKNKQLNDQASYSNNKMTNSSRRTATSAPDSQQGGNFRTNGENMIAKMTSAFQPKGNYAKRKSADNYLNESKLGRYYLRLINELAKSDADCTLFDDGIDTRANSDVIQFGDVDETPESIVASQTPLAGPSSAERSNQSFEAAVASHYAQSTSDEEYYQRIHNADVTDDSKAESDAATQINSVAPRSSESGRHFKSAAVSSAPMDDTKSADESHHAGFSSHASEQAAQSDHDNNSNESAVVSSEAPQSMDEHPQVNKAEHKPKRGLGHSLSSILDNETDAQKDVEFFKDELGTPKSSVAESVVQAPATKSDVEPHQVTSASHDDENAPGVFPVENTDHETLSSGTEYDQGYQFPQFSLLNEPQRSDDEDLDDWIIKQSEILDRTLHAFHVNAEVVDWTNGPTVTQFQVKLALGVKVSKITNLNDDLKLALAAKDIRIEAPIPGRTTVGVEIPNPKPRPVMLSEVLDDDAFRQAKSDLTIALGVDLTGKPQVTDIAKMPHGLIAGATGSGKSVFINSLLVSLLYKATPAQLRLLLIDPKAVELAPYNNIPHLLAPVISEPNEASAALKWAVKEMDERYEKLAAAGARNIEQFNEKADESNQPALKMPYIVIIIDELADLMMVASTEVQDYIVRITQKARAAGIHLIVATQRPSVDIVTGTIKNNIPTRIAFMVSSQVDSRTIIDTAGAERLLGKGDMLYLGNGKSQPLRIQGTFVTNDEIERVTAAVRTQGTPKYAFNPKSLLKKVNMVQQQDEIMPEVLAYIAKEKTVSTSKLQRVFSIGYNRAASLIDDLEQQNYISGQHGSKPREVYLTEDDYKKLNL
ncbi:DNA translocase FtsK [Nicoliella lavandulae]|uniref:DNA translocase FtsK n=1 Tax=Nicoliella lavandulae TaxID=3082954 RepID=A0ABU8SLQ3_9LACO